jgi:hypothetical protein
MTGPEHLGTRLHSGDRLEQLHGFDPQRMRQLNDIDQADVTLPSLDPPDVVSMQLR